jgi:hypothetical protein
MADCLRHVLSAKSGTISIADDENGLWFYWLALRHSMGTAAYANLSLPQCNVMVAMLNLVRRP